MFLLTFWHPHFASVTTIRVGNLGYRYVDIFWPQLVSSFIWNTFWGLLMYFLGTLIKASTKLGSMDYKWLVYVYVMGWIIIEVYHYLRDNKKTLASI
jgi:membrane protein DedA with SNARE-associated domain